MTKPSRDRYAGKFHFGDSASKSAKRDAERQWQQLPPDTRGLTARIMGDPTPGRSALDRKRALADAGKSGIISSSVRCS